MQICVKFKTESHHVNPTNAHSWLPSECARELSGVTNDSAALETRFRNRGRPRPTLDVEPFAYWFLMIALGPLPALGPGSRPMIRLLGRLRSTMTEPISVVSTAPTLPSVSATSMRM
ncbi:hypothetical protein SAMN05444166_8097 [Singulisphaera sp. GP187]|nr:hypothetical protein SAMN05444166_8097 [Singulisphaera sp. GP187]